MHEVRQAWTPDEDELLLELRDTKSLMFQQIATEFSKAGLNRSEKSCASRHRYLTGRKVYTKEAPAKRINWPCEAEMLACHRPWIQENQNESTAVGEVSSKIEDKEATH